LNFSKIKELVKSSKHSSGSNQIFIRQSFVFNNYSVMNFAATHKYWLISTATDVSPGY